MTMDPGSDPCEHVILTAPDGATLTVSAYGGQVLGWAPAPGQERLWLSPAAVCGNGQAIRGGIPVIFPQFSGRGPLPKHGIARDRAWTAEVIPDDEAALWTAHLDADDATLAIWPAHFTVRITARATARDLQIMLEVTNTGSTAWSFAAALHSYLRVTGDSASITGLGGHAIEQNASPGEIAPAGGDPAAWAALDTRDVRLLDVHEPVVLTDPGLASLSLTATGFPDRVVWNPGANNGIGDIPDGDERAFVCIEPAVVDDVELAPGKAWGGQQMFSI